MINFGHNNPDEFDVNQLIGKTIFKVSPLPRQEPHRTDEWMCWLIEFTDGDRIEFVAQYSDSAVFIKEPRK